MRPYMQGAVLKALAIAVPAGAAVAFFDVMGGSLGGLEMAFGWLVAAVKATTGIDLGDDTFGRVLIYLLLIIGIAVFLLILARLTRPFTEAGRSGGGASSAAADRARNLRRRYLQHLEREVDNRLKASIHYAVQLDLRLDERRDATVPWHFLAAGNGRARAFDAFDHALSHFDRRVLLFGHPGSGKSTTLLLLAQRLIREALDDDAAPIPLLENLSRFQRLVLESNSNKGLLGRLRQGGESDPDLDPKHHDLAIQKRLADLVGSLPVGGLTPGVVNDWIEDGRAYLLLDGLDEVDEKLLPEFAARLNATLLARHPELPTVVASRIIEYQVLEQSRCMLHLNGAVTLQELSDEQITGYLKSVGAEALSAALPNDAALKELARNPLTLSMMALAYRGLPAPDVRDDVSLIERRHQLFENYIDRMMQRAAFRRANRPWDPNRPHECLPTLYTRTALNRYLGRLAVALSERADIRFPVRRIGDFFLKDRIGDGKPFWSVKLASTLVALVALGALTSVFLALLHRFDGPRGAEALLPFAAAMAAGAAIVGLQWGEQRLRQWEGERRSFVTWARWGVNGAFGGGLAVGGFLLVAVCGQAMARVLDRAPQDGPWFSVLLTVVALGCGMVADKWKHGRDGLWNNAEVGAAAAGGVALIVAGGLLGSLWEGEWMASGAALASVLPFLILAYLWNDGGDRWAFMALTAAGAGIVFGESWLAAWLLPLSGTLVVIGALGFWIGLLAMASVDVAAVSLVMSVVGVSLVHDDGTIAVLAGLAGLPAMLVVEALRGSGGEGVILPRIAAAILRLRRDVPWRFERFIGYGRDTLLLRKAGGDCEFMHLLLRDHFAVRDLTPHLIGADVEKQVKIIRQLARQGAAAYHTLHHLAEDPDRRVREEAVRALVRLPVPEMAAAIHGILRNEPLPRIRKLAVAGMARLPKGAVGEITRAFLADRDAEVRRAMAQHLRRDWAGRWYLNDSEIEECIHALIKDADDEIVSIGLLLFYNNSWRINLKEKDIEIKVLLRGAAWALERGDDDERTDIVRLLAHRPEAAVALLQKALKDPAVPVRVAAAWAFEALPATAAVPPLTDGVADAHPEVRAAVVGTLSRLMAKEDDRRSLGRESLERIEAILSDALRDRKPEIRAAATPSIAWLPGDGEGRIRRALHDRSSAVRSAALFHVPWHRHADLADEVYALLGDRRCWKDAARAIGSFGDPGLVSRLLGDLETTWSYWKQCGLIEALKHCRAAQAVPTLARLAIRCSGGLGWIRERKGGLSWRSSERAPIGPRMRCCVEALAAIGGPEAHTALRGLLSHRLPIVRLLVLAASEKESNAQRVELFITALDDANSSVVAGASRKLEVLAKAGNTDARDALAAREARRAAKAARV